MIIESAPLAEVFSSAAMQREADARRLRATLHYFWFTFWAFALGLATALSWDGEYHRTRVFDTAFSPPHVFAYALACLCALLCARLAFTAHMRRWFGRDGLWLRPIPFRIPGPLFLLGAGFVLLGIAGALDLTWHSLFGLDETGWSLPHSMIGCALLLIFLGFLSCRQALAAAQPLSAAGAFILLLLVLTLGTGPLLGPLISNISPAEVHAHALAPIVLQEPSAQHTYRIYLHWNLTRTNPLFVPLAALWLGVVLAFACAIEPRLGVCLVTVGAWSLLLVTPLPIWLACGAILLLARWRLPRANWAVAGALFGLMGAYTWDNHALALLFALLGAPLLVLGSRLGERLAQCVLNPMERHGYLMVSLGLLLPCFTGAVDLFLRATTP